MPRGRTIFKFIARIALLDTEAMQRDPDGAGPLVSGYDEDFQEPVVIKRNSDDRVGDVLRKESLIEAPAQIDPRVFDAISQVLGGTSPNTDIELTFHFQNLEQLNLVDRDGIPKISIADRLDSIWTCDGRLVQDIPLPGLFVTQTRPAGWGLSLRNPQRNLLVVRFEDRDQGPQR